MGASAAVEVLHRRELAAERDPRARASLVVSLAAHHEATTGGLARALDSGVVDAVIEPHETRRVLLRDARRPAAAPGRAARQRAAVSPAPAHAWSPPGRTGEVAWTALGPGSPVTVFAHGLGGSAAETRPLATGVPGTRVLLSFRGHGASGPLPGGWDYDLLAADLRAVADEVRRDAGGRALARRRRADAPARERPGPLRAGGLPAARRDRPHPRRRRDPAAGGARRRDRRRRPRRRARDPACTTSRRRCATAAASRRWSGAGPYSCSSARPPARCGDDRPLVDRAVAGRGHGARARRRPGGRPAAPARRRRRARRAAAGGPAAARSARVVCSGPRPARCRTPSPPTCERTTRDRPARGQARARDRGAHRAVHRLLGRPRGGRAGRHAGAVAASAAAPRSPAGSPAACRASRRSSSST